MLQIWFSGNAMHMCCSGVACIRLYVCLRKRSSNDEIKIDVGCKFFHVAVDMVLINMVIASSMASNVPLISHGTSPPNDPGCPYYYTITTAKYHQHHNIVQYHTGCV